MKRYFFINGVAHESENGSWVKHEDIGEEAMNVLYEEIERLKAEIEKLEKEIKDLEDKLLKVIDMLDEAGKVERRYKDLIMMVER